MPAGAPSPLSYSPLPGHGLLNLFSPSCIRCRQAVQQSVRAHVQRGAEAGQCCDWKREFAIFDVADRLPVHPYELGQAFLGEIRLQTSRLDVLAHKPKDLSIRHPSFEAREIWKLTSNMFDVNRISCSCDDSARTHTKGG